MVTSVRPASISDAQALAELADKLMPGEGKTADRINVLRQSLGKPNYHLYVAQENGRVIGFVDIWIFSDFTHGARMGIIQNIFVDRRFRRRGVGDLLMRRITRKATQLKVKELHVWTSFRNRAAIMLYRKYNLRKRSLLLERAFEW